MKNAVMVLGVIAAMALSACGKSGSSNNDPWGYNGMMGGMGNPQMMQMCMQFYPNGQFNQQMAMMYNQQMAQQCYQSFGPVMNGGMMNGGMNGGCNQFNNFCGGMNGMNGFNGMNGMNGFGGCMAPNGIRMC
jgi:hypothetical protein